MGKKQEELAVPECLQSYDFVMETWWDSFPGWNVALDIQAF